MSCFQFEPRGLSLSTLLRHLPDGVAWIAWRMPGKTARRLMDAIAEAYEDMTQAICDMTTEIDCRTTTQLITEWETAVGLPDPCLPTVATLAERRTWVQWRLTKRRYSTVADWNYLASLFGLEIAITPGWHVQRISLYPARYPKPYDRFPKLGRFRVYINVLNQPQVGYDYGALDRGPGYPVPYGYRDPELYAKFKCLIERVKPANVAIVWDYPLEVSPYGMCLTDDADGYKTYTTDCP